MCIPKGAVKKAHSDVEAIDPLTPVSFDRVLLEVDSVTGDLADVRVIEAGGVELEFRFGRWEQDLPIADAQFRFQSPPGTVLLDDSAAR